MVIRAGNNALTVTENLTGYASLLASALFAGCAVTAGFALVIALTIARCAAILVVRAGDDALTVTEDLAGYTTLLAGALFA